VTERDQFDALAVLLTDAIAATKSLLHVQLNIRPRTKRYKLFALIATNHLMQKCESIAAMTGAKAYAGINVVARSAFETYADVLNLFKHKDTYPDYMSWASFKQQDTLFRLGFGDSSPYAEQLERDSVASMGVTRAAIVAENVRQLAETEARLPALYRNSKGKVEDRDLFKFELADRVEEYNALFRHLSGSTHGRISAMGDGIFDSDEAITWITC
jgi:hypothetical protein